jgi:hypothetical protein
MDMRNAIDPAVTVELGRDYPDLREAVARLCEGYPGEYWRKLDEESGYPLARAYAELEAADMMCRRAAALFTAGQDCGADANIAKLLASEATWKAAEAAMQTYGGFAFAREYDIERKWRESRLYQIAPISTNLVLSYLAQHVLGLPRSF